MFTLKDSWDVVRHNRQLLMYQCLLGEPHLQLMNPRQTGKSTLKVTLDEVFAEAWNSLHKQPRIHELPCAELDTKLKAEWVEIQHNKKMLNHREHWRSKRNRGFTGYYSVKR